MITVYGDSISVGLVYNESTGRYTLCRQSYLRNISAMGYQIQNRSVIGSTIDQGLRLFLRDHPKPGDLCLVEFGGNDSDLNWQEVSEHPEIFHDGKNSHLQFEHYLTDFIHQIKAFCLIPCLVVPPPIVSARYFDWVSKGKNADNILRYLGNKERIHQWHAGYSELINKAASAEKCGIIDFRSRFLKQGHFQDYICLDGIHPNEAGHRLMTECLLEWIESAGSEIHRAFTAERACTTVSS